MQKPTYASLNSMVPEKIGERLGKRVINGTSMTFTHYSFKSGGSFPRHVHDQEQITLVVTGRLTFLIEGEPKLVDEGSVVVIPSGMPHSAEAGPDGAEVVCIVSPARNDSSGISIVEDR